ncbi:MAG: CoA transferase, partial [Oscillospiraceae bacterium]|nr:CoA transferase [Oscillospiraceae bacterium]
MSEKEYPLAGTVVIDFSTVVAAPSAARMLADLGACVIKVETRTGDTTRYHDALPTLRPESYCFTNCNANKKCISIDIKTPGGRGAFLRLLEEADVLITNIRLKSLVRAGLDYESLKDRYPELIYAHFTGYGYQGPDAELPGYDMSGFWSRSGAMLDGHMDDSRRLYEPAYGMGDLFCAGYFAAGILAALLGREKTGHGTMVSTSLLHSGVWANSRNIIPAQEAIGDPVPLPEKWNYNMFYRAYRCADGKWLCLAFDYLKHFRPACDVFGLDDIREDPRFQTQGALRANEVAEELALRVEKVIAQKPREHWIRALRERDMVYAPVQSATEVSLDPQVLENGFLERVDFHNGADVLMPSIPIQFTDFGVRKVTPAAPLGANTRE